MYKLKTNQGTDTILTHVELKRRIDVLRDLKISYTLIHPNGDKSHHEAPKKNSHDSSRR